MRYSEVLKLGQPGYKWLVVKKTGKRYPLNWVFLKQDHMKYAVVSLKVGGMLKALEYFHTELEVWQKP